MSVAEVSDRFAVDVPQLVELFQTGDWAELRVETDDFSVLLSRDPQARTAEGGGAAVTPPTGKPVTRLDEEPAVAPSPAHRAPATASLNRDPSWQVVAAPNLGTFYRSPKPGTPPFIGVGERVEPETEICLLEVMKLFTSVKAGMSGTVREIAANDAELVESGQPLFYIEPQES